MLMVVVFLFGCQPENVFKEIKTIENSTWKYEETLTFETTIHDTVGTYDIGIIIDHLKAFPYQNLYLRFNYNESAQPRTDTITLDLVGKNGYYTGNCGNDACRLEKILLTDVSFHNSGKQTFSFEQFTRNESLEGINELGMFIRKTVSE
jgi:gliding motility-associated lipoprotein GldH